MTKVGTRKLKSYLPPLRHRKSAAMCLGKKKKERKRVYGKSRSEPF